MARRQKFEDNFWSDTNQGFEVLLNGMKSQVSASKELMDFIKERAGVEENHSKSLSKVYKQMGHASDTSVGAYFPVWIVSIEMLGKLAETNNTFVRNLLDLAKEVGEYNQSQKDKMKSNMKGEIETAKEAYHMLEVADGAVQKTKKSYEAAHHDHATLQQELTTLQNLGPAAKVKDIEKVDAKVKKAEALLIHTKQEYTSAVDNHVKLMMEYQGKHKEACMKFETIEEEHLAQMVTFTIQLASALEANVSMVDKVQKDTVRKISDLSVDKLINFYVHTKKTGTDIPRPEKVRLVKEASPSPSNVSAVSQSNVSTTSEASTQKAAKERGLLKLFKRGKQATVDTSTTSNGPNTSQQPDAEVPEVDEEGYSIRPQDAERITGFSDITAADSDSDLDDDNDTTSKLKNIHIREASNPVSTATVDDIKASLRGLQLPSPHSPVLSKAGSLNALNKLGTSDRSPTAVRRAYLSPTDGMNKPMALSLYDLDAKGVDIRVSTPPGMPPPLIPTVGDLFGGTTTTTTDQLPGSGGGKKLSKAETTDFADFSANFGDNSTTGLSWGGSDTPNAKKTSTPVATTPVSSNVEVSTPPTVQAKSSEAGIKPITSNLQPPSASPILPKPPQGNRRRLKTGSSNQTEPPILEGPPFPTKRRATMSADNAESTKSNNNSSSVSASTSFPLGSKSTNESNAKKPVPIPRRNTLERGSSSTSSPLITSATKSPNVSSSSLLVLDNRNEENTSLQPEQQQPRKESSSVLSSSSSLTTISSTDSSVQGKPSSDNALVIPIAVAIQETVNASFKGKTSITKVTGEVDMSFATSFLQQLSSHVPLSFRLSHTDCVERLQHNRNLVTLENDGDYKFNMQALCSFLNGEVSKSSTPAKFYNVQVFRYEVVLKGGVDDLPLRLRCFWKCDPAVTNYRIDYKYNEISVKKFPLTNLAICVPVDGIVQRHLCKPEGKWSEDQQKLIWQFPQVGIEPQSLQAKFELSEGPSHPSPTLVQFNCEGAILSRMQLDLIGQAYKISFMKNKLSTGKYVAMPAE